jgi:hypothetical protein
MNCTKCGAPLDPGDSFCEVCGTPVQKSGAAPAGNPVPPRAAVPPYSGGSFPSQEESNTKLIRGWFQVKAPKWPLLISLLGLCLIGTGIPGVILIIVGIALYIYLIVTRSTAGQQEVDAAWNRQISVLSSRALAKLNLIDDQTSLIDPVVTVGYGSAPDTSFAASKSDAASRKGLLKSIFGSTLGRLIGSMSKNGTELDPYEAYRIGDDEGIRSMLLEVNTYYFTDTQVLLYSADVDISTGLIYHEETSEVFYEDIEGIEFEQELFKVYNTKKKKYINKKRENMVLYLGGCNLKSSVNMDVNDTYMDSHRQFAAMRNLIREKKN